MRKLFPCLIGIMMLLSSTGCASFLTGGNQKVTIKTNNPDAVVYIDNEEVGSGESMLIKVKKGSTKQVTVRTPGYLDEHYVLMPNKHCNGYWPLFVLDIGFLIMPGIYDLMLPTYGRKFDDKYEFEPSHPNRNRNVAANEKYVNLDAIKMDIKDTDKDLKSYYVAWNQDIYGAIEKAENKKSAEEEKLRLQEEKRGKKKGGKLIEDNQIQYDNTKFSYEIEKTLRKTGFVDTVNQIFADDNNTLLLTAKINNIKFYTISKNYFSYRKVKMGITWYIKNGYEEILDSVSTEDFSGDFKKTYFTYNTSQADIDNYLYDILAECVNISYNNLMDEAVVKKHLQPITDFGIADAPLKLNSVTDPVLEVADAGEASVILKRKGGGHGSGFAITHDGYILTNYHVISGDYPGKLCEMTAVIPGGEEVPCTIVRHNKMRDIALLKIDRPFKKAFKVSSDKTFKNLMEVYTIGAPKSIELGQSVTLGLISNERTANNNNLLQLSMSVNPGNSGGPLFDKVGNLQGVIVSKLVGYATEGVGFAIPGYKLSEYLNISYNEVPVVNDTKKDKKGNKGKGK